MKSIHHRLWFWMTSLIIVVLLITFSIQVLLLPKFYYLRHERILYNETSKLGEAVSLESISDDEQSDSGRKLATYADETDSFIAVLDNEKELVYAYVPKVFEKRPEGINFKIQLMHMLERETNILFRDYSKETQLDRKFIDPINNYIYIISTPLISDDSVEGIMIVISPIPVIDEAVGIVAYQFLPISIISLLIGAFLAKVLSRKFSDPIEAMKLAAQRIAKGENRIQVAVGTKDEIGELGEAINHMALQLEKIESLRRELIGNTSHELKTPIGLIKGYGMMMKEIKEESQHFDDYLDIIIDESDRLTAMIEDMLLMSKIQAGEDIIRLESFNLEDLLISVIQKLNLFAKSRHVELKYVSMSSEKWISGDPQKLFQVFYNFMHNSIKYAHEDTNVLVSIENDGMDLVVSIEDQGVGISEKELPYIWERFYKTRNHESIRIKGTGLGLAIVKSILDQHQYDYGIKSKQFAGTLAWIKIPKDETQLKYEIS